MAILPHIGSSAELHEHQDGPSKLYQNVCWVPDQLARWIYLGIIGKVHDAVYYYTSVSVLHFVIDRWYETFNRHFSSWSKYLFIRCDFCWTRVFQRLWRITGSIELFGKGLLFKRERWFIIGRRSAGIAFRNRKGNSATVSAPSGCSHTNETLSSRKGRGNGFTRIRVKSFRELFSFASTVFRSSALVTYLQSCQLLYTYLCWSQPSTGHRLRSDFSNHIDHTVSNTSSHRSAASYIFSTGTDSPVRAGWLILRRLHAGAYRRDHLQLPKNDIRTNFLGVNFNHVTITADALMD